MAQQFDRFMEPFCFSLALGGGKILRNVNVPVDRSQSNRHPLGRLDPDLVSLSGKGAAGGVIFQNSLLIGRWLLMLG